MKSYLALIKVDFKLASRSREVLFFNYLFPLILFFIFAEMMGAERGGAIVYVVSMVLTLGILGNGLFGAGMRAVQERETNVLRRYKVTPISPLPLLVASLVTGWLIFLPIAVVTLALAHILYGMPVPHNGFSLFGLISLGVLAFRAIGLILAAVANSSQESQVLIQLLYMPMIFLSGATIPVAFLPKWARLISQFLPASYLVTGFQGVFFRNQSLWENSSAVGALLLTLILALFIAKKIFRWEKGEKIPSAAKGWVLAVLTPFLVLGTYQAFHEDHLSQQRVLYRDLQRSGTVLIRGARIFVGDGRIIETGGLLLRNGKIEGLYSDKIPDPKALKADVIEGAGKTLLPGLIDVQVYLAASGGIGDQPEPSVSPNTLAHELSAYLYCGITTVVSAGDPLDPLLKLRSRISNGGRLGANLYLCGSLYTVEAERGTELLGQIPGFIQVQPLAQWVRLPRDPEETRRNIRGLKVRGVEGVRGILRSSGLDEESDVTMLQVAAQEVRSQRMLLVVLAGNNQGIGNALLIGVDGIEDGSTPEAISDRLLADMAQKGIAFDPSLSKVEALSQLYDGKQDLLNRALAEQVGPTSLIEGVRKALQTKKSNQIITSLGEFHPNLAQASNNLRRAYQAGVKLVTGSGAGNPLVFHGPTIHRELQLWVDAGIPASVALQAATYNAAHLLRLDDRIGLIKEGYEADLLLVDGDPLSDITATERISLVVFKGERVNRAALFSQE
ncbi:MAG TPA: ABC transporter permease [Terriglobia bacterium]|nr:ABC transporter permease [Terriglobia bacterium]